MPQLSVRAMTKEDLPAVCTLLAQMDDEPVMELESARALYLETQRFPFYVTYLMFDGEEAVGTFCLLIYPALVHDGAKQAVLDGVVIRADRRGQGLGRFMLAESLRLAREAGAYKVMLSSNIKREEAHAFYLAHGFKQHGISFSTAVIPSEELDPVQA